MGLFNRQSSTIQIPVSEPVAKTPSAKTPSIEGWSEADMVAVYNAASVRNLKPGESLIQDASGSDSFLIVVNGSMQIEVKSADQAGPLECYVKGDSIAPLPKSAGHTYSVKAVEATTVLEITPPVMGMLPERMQLTIYKAALRSNRKVATALHDTSSKGNANNALLAQYILKQHDEHMASVKSDFVQQYLKNIPKLPTYATSLAGNLMDDRLPVKEVVDGINRDPAIVGIVLRNVNSAQYSFPKKIESFYNACMILGFNNIYNLIMREALHSAMPVTADTRRMHQHSVLISVLCYEIAAATKTVQCQTATTFGLLHDIGKGVKSLMKIAHPERSDQIDALPPDALTEQLLTLWGLPERICGMIGSQHHPEFMPPDMIDANYRAECATLYLAHVLQALMTGEAADPVLTIYAKDHLAILGLPYSSPTELLNQRVMPILLKNRRRLPDLIQGFVEKAAKTVEVQQS
jgi:HD-like signal output (HDOD) protein